MGERRKRKPLWDSEDEIKHRTGVREHRSLTGKDRHSNHRSGLHEFSDSRSTISRESRDHSEWQSWESIELPNALINSSFQSSPEGREMDGGKGYHKNVSPGFDGMGYDHTHEYDRSHHQRYMGRGRSTSRSRSRNIGRSRSRNRSRSRSRSRSDGNAYDHRRSISPVRDNRRQSYGFNDKGSGPEKSSKTCRDFTSVRCRRSHDCRFFHPNSTNYRDNDEEDTVENWRSRDHNRIPKHSYSRSGFELQNDEQFLSKSRSSAPCKDFMRGNCRWGETCRFSHATPADSVGHDTRKMSFDKDFDHQQQKTGKPICKYFAARKCNKDNCRFAHEGSNHTNLESRVGEVTDSRSSHDKSSWRNDSERGETMIFNIGDKQKNDTWEPWGGTGGEAWKLWGITGDDSDGQNDDTQKPWGSSGDTGNRQNDDAQNLWGSMGDTDDRQNDDTRMSWGRTGDNGFRQNDDTQKPWVSTHDTGNRQNNGWGPWGSTGDAGSGQNDDGWGPWGSSGDTRNKQNNDGWGSWGTSGDTGNRQNDDGWGTLNDCSKNEDKNKGIKEPASNSWNCEKQPSIPGENQSYGGDTVAEDSIASKQERLILHGLQLLNGDEIVNPHKLIASEENQGVSMEALQQNVPPASHIQHQHCRVIESNPLKSFEYDVLDEVKDTRLSSRPIVLPGESLNRNGIGVYPYHSSITSDTNLNAPETPTVNPFNVQIHTQNNQKADQSRGLLEANSPQLIMNLLTSKHSDQVTSSSVTTAGPQIHSVANVGQSFKNGLSQAYSGMNISPSRGVLPSLPSTAVCLPLVNRANAQPNPGAVSVSKGNKREITDHCNDNLTHGTEVNDQMQLKGSSPSSVLGTEFDGSKANPREIPEQREEIAGNIGVIGGAKVVGEESKGIQETKPSATLDDHVKPEDMNADKDEKGLRIFKNALIEFVKEILKPTWKEGRMSREVHKTIVKKVVDKVSSVIQVDHVPNTQEKAEQYLSFSKPKITKLVQAYVERCQKPDG